MRTLLIPTQGVPFFGEDLPDDRVGQPLARYTGPPLLVRADIHRIAPEPVIEHLSFYDYRSVVVRREGQPILAIYEQRT